MLERQQKMVRWFTNQKGSPTATSTSSPKRPRATNGASVFAEEHKARITGRMAEQQSQEGGSPEKVNLARYHAVKQEFYNQLTEEERSGYDAKAAERNNARKAMPEPSQIFE